VKARVIRCGDFAGDAARFILDEARAALSGRGIFRLGLSGGQTPRAVHAEMVRLGKGIAWERVQVTFGDERCVPPEDASSNFRMARESLLDPLALPAGNVFRIRGEIAPEDAAREYEQKLATVAQRMGEERYVHDLLLLGLGEDGHTASLFPGSPALSETVRNVIPARGPKPPPQRVTMTFPLINAARHVCFLVNDRAKDALVEAIAGGNNADYPAAMVRPASGAVTWLVGA
jgi:6-phosphogluconolactonase